MQNCAPEARHWALIKMILQMLIRREEAYMTPEKLLAIINENGITRIRVTGRGGIEISPEELKNSDEFKKMENYARHRVRKDIASLKARGYDIK
ncbi:hypothetical protein ACXWYY_002975 [Enterobacter hormaechei]